MPNEFSVHGISFLFNIELRKETNSDLKGVPKVLKRSLILLPDAKVPPVCNKNLYEVSAFFKHFIRVQKIGYKIALTKK